MAATLALLVTIAPRQGAAYDFEVFARSEGYGYQLRRYERGGVAFLNRRRYTQYLGLRVFNLLDPGQRAFAPGTSGEAPALLTLHALMRFDTDFGAFINQGGSVPELQNNQFDLMLGVLEGKNLFGLLDLTLGRQYDSELFDFFAFDGLRLRLNLPWRLRGASFSGYLEAYFGVQVAQARPFSAAVFETDGVSGDHTDDAWSPAFGVAGGLSGPWDIGLRLAYRGVASRAPEVAPVDGAENPGRTIWGVDQEALFVGASLQIPRLGTRPLFGLRYNLLTAQVDDVQLRLSQELDRHRLWGEMVRSRPHFDGDSIFNIFATEPYTEGALGYEVRILDPLAAHLRLGYRRFWSDEAEGDAARPDAFSGALGARYRGLRLGAGAEAFFLAGHGGTTVGGDLDGSLRLFGRLTLEGRLSLIHHDGEGLLQTAGVNFGVQVGGRVLLHRGIDLHLLLEDNINARYNSALRLLGVLNLEVAP